MDRAYRICSRCVMDTSDPAIEFRSDGVCSHCCTFERHQLESWRPEDGRDQLLRLVETIKRRAKGKEFDCALGLSGGVDSSYLALVARRELKLRVLAVHVDSGWNSEIAVRNIESVCRHLEIELHTHVLDWDEVRDLQLAFLRAGVPNLDVPQDHAFTAALYREAAAHGVSTLLSGGNMATESVLPRAWGHAAMDLRSLRAIHARFGERRLQTFPTLSFFQYYVYYPRVLRIRSVRPLDYISYRKDEAVSSLREAVGFVPYGPKHGESRFTRFFQNYYLPRRFGYDKRRAHYSSLILAGQMERSLALQQLEEPLYQEADLREDRRFFVKKLGITDDEFERLVSQPLRDHRSFPSNEWIFGVKDRLKRFYTATRAVRRRLLAPGPRAAI